MICRVLWSFTTSIVYPYFSLYVLALGGSPAEVGLINGVGLVSGMLLYPLGGYVADRSGRVKLIGYSTILYALTHALFLFARNWVWLFVGQLFSQLLLFYMPAMNALESDSIPPGVRGKGFALMMAVPSAVRIIAPIVGGYAIGWFQANSLMSGEEALVYALRICWGIALLTGFVVAYLRLTYLEETIPESMQGEPFSVKQTLRSIIPSYRSVWGTVQAMSSTIRVIAGIEMFTAFFIAMTAPFYVVYARNVVGVTEANWGQLLFISGLLGILVALPLGGLVDRLGSRRMILIGMFMLPFFILGFTYTTGFVSLAIVLCGITLCNNVMIPAFSALIADSVPRGLRGRMYSVIGERGVSINFGNFWGSGLLIFPPAAFGAFLGGYFYDYSPRLLYLVTSAALFVGFILVYLYVKEPETVQE